MESKNSIVDRIRTLANSQGYSLPSLEMKLNLGNGTISRWNKSAPNSDKLLRVADFFNVSIDYLLGRSPSSDNSDYAQMLQKLKQPISFDNTVHPPFSNLSEEDIAALFCSINGKSVIIAGAEECDLIHKFRLLDSRGKSAVLNVLEHEYAALPGNAASSTSRQA